MITYTIQDLLHMAACFGLILSGVICGVIRWFHMCRPYNLQPDYFFSARKSAILLFLGLILLTPYVINVNSEDTWLFARIFGVIYYPSVFSWLILNYFKSKLKNKSYRHILIEVPTMTFIIYLLLGTTSLYNISSHKYLPYFAGVWSAIILIDMICISMWLKRKVFNYNKDLYSNSEDFPYRFAQIVLITTLIIVALTWFVFLTNSRDVKMYVDCVLMIYNVGILCIILHPHKILNTEQNYVLDKIQSEDNSIIEKVENNDTCEEEEDNSKKIKLTPEQLEHFQKLILYEVEEKQAYLDCHYSLDKLSKSIHIGRTYTSIVCRSMGGFYNLINKYRVEYADKLQKEHPNLTMESISMESGFKDRKAYHRARKANYKK